jgi:hypothetical protein
VLRQQGRQVFVERLLAFPVMQKFSADMVVQSLHAMVKSTTPHPDRCIAKLSMLQAAQQLSSLQVLQLLQAAVEVGSACVVRFIRGLPAAKQLCSSDMAKLEELAAETGKDECLWALRRARHVWGVGL